MNNYVTNLETVKKGYMKLYSVAPTTKHLQALSSKELKKCYKAGLAKKPMSKKIAYSFAGIMAMLLVTVVLYTNYQSQQGQIDSSTNTSQSGGKPAILQPKTLTTNNSPAPNKASTQSSDSSNAALPPGKAQTMDCKVVVLPHGTVYEDVNYLNLGETKTSPGADGRENSCSYNGGPYKVESRFEPYDTVVYTGTYVAKKPVSTRMTPQTAASNCAARGVSSDSSAWQLCINAYLSQY